MVAVVREASGIRCAASVAASVADSVERTATMDTVAARWLRLLQLAEPTKARKLNSSERGFFYASVNFTGESFLNLSPQAIIATRRRSGIDKVHRALGCVNLR